MNDVKQLQFCHSSFFPFFSFFLFYRENTSTIRFQIRQLAHKRFPFSKPIGAVRACCQGLRGCRDLLTALRTRILSSQIGISTEAVNFNILKRKFSVFGSTKRKADREALFFRVYMSRIVGNCDKICRDNTEFDYAKCEKKNLCMSLFTEIFV